MMQVLTKIPDVNGGSPVVNGRGLSHLKLSNDELVRLAADLATGQRPFQPSLKQTNLLTGVPVAAIRAELKARAARKNGQPPKDLTVAIVTAWDAASEHERELAVRTIGIAEVWDVISSVVA
jgi:hypothetical protein